MLIGPQISPADAALAARLAAVRAAIADAAASAGRTEDSITLVAVSKGHGAGRVRQAFALGVRDVGESYLQEAIGKLAALQDLPLRWHFIGRLQANKTRPIAEQFDWVHGVDRLQIAERLSSQRPAALAPLNVCIQINIAEEAAKAGVAPEALPALAAAIPALPGLRLRGLMCILPAGLDSAGNRQLFAAARGWLERLNAARSDPSVRPLDTLSMGMSGDFRDAIAEGATCIRIGTALFGARERGHPAEPGSGPASTSTAGLG